MEYVSSILHFFLHLDQHLDRMCRDYGTWTYGILFAIVFAETGLVITPFLPGDSLLFAAGVLAGRANAALNAGYLFLLLATAAIVGDNCNYWLGRLIGSRIKFRDDARVLKKKYLDRTHEFFVKYGVKAIILARFVPIVRTFMPFVAGIGRMDYRVYLPFDILGGVLWVSGCVYAGYFFGRREFVKNHFELVVLAIIFISVLPMVIEYLRHRTAKRRALNPQVDRTPTATKL